MSRLLMENSKLTLTFSCFLEKYYKLLFLIKEKLSGNVIGRTETYSSRQLQTLACQLDKLFSDPIKISEMVLVTL